MRRRSRLSLYQDSSGQTALHESGFSWVAGFMLPAWLMLHGFAGWVVLLLAMLQSIVALTLQKAYPNHGSWISLLLMLLLGGVANRCYRWHLERQGWVMTAKEAQP